MNLVCPTCREAAAIINSSFLWYCCPCYKWQYGIDQNGNINEYYIIQGNLTLRSWGAMQSTTLHDSMNKLLALNYVPIIDSQEVLDNIIKRLLNLKAFS